MFPLILLLGGALALIGVLPTVPPTFNVGLWQSTHLMTLDVMEAFLVYLPTSPAVEVTAAFVGDVVDVTVGVVGDIVGNAHSSAAAALPVFFWSSDMSRGGIGYYSVHYYDWQADVMFVDMLGGVDMANGTGDLIVVKAPPRDVMEEVGVSSSTDKAVDDSCDGDSDCLPTITAAEYERLVLLLAVSIYCLPSIIIHAGKLIGTLLGKLPFADWLIDDLRADCANVPRLLLLIAYVGAGTYLLEEALLGPFFYDSFARISWLMERGRIDTMFMAQEFLILYLWAWCKTVVPMERARWRVVAGLEGVAAVEDWALHDKDDGAHRRTSGSAELSGYWTVKVLKAFDEDYAQTREFVHRPYLMREKAVLDDSN